MALQFVAPYESIVARVFDILPICIFSEDWRLLHIESRVNDISHIAYVNIK